VSGGLHGVGVSVVNALSEWLNVVVKRDGKVFHQEFARGEPTTDLKKTGPTKETGTTITFLPDVEERHEFYAEGGIRDFVSYVNDQKDPVHKHVIYFEGAANGDSEADGQVEVAMQWNTSYVESVFSFANNIN